LPPVSREKKIALLLNNMLIILLFASKLIRNRFLPENTLVGAFYGFAIKSTESPAPVGARSVSGLTIISECVPGGAVIELKELRIQLPFPLTVTFWIRMG
jgi:hypothetical protein